MIALVDYGVGNLRSVEKALKACAPAGQVVVVSADPEVILQAEKAVLPGVGAFGDGMAGLRARGLVEVMYHLAHKGTPLLGICLGMQLFFESSEELRQHQGLGLLPGRVVRFPTAAMAGIKVPQTGWNQVLAKQASPLLKGLAEGSYAYFNHSYFCAAQDADVLAETEYGLRYPCAVGRGRIFGVQFHPEKSQAGGLQLLKNFVEHC